MKINKREAFQSIQSKMIAPCGMNCSLCIGHLRERKPCPGCNGDDRKKPRHCVSCKIKNCETIGNKPGYCFSCDLFPCTRLKRLDKRYQTKYGMSMIENLKAIQNFGIRSFIKSEKKRWACPECAGTICVHRRNCLFCGADRERRGSGSIMS